MQHSVDIFFMIMEHRTRLLKFVLGICIVNSYVKSESVNLYYGCNPKNPNEDVTGQLAELNREKLNIERVLASTPPHSSPRYYLEKELNNVEALIQQQKTAPCVLYKDYLQMMEEHKEQLQKEKAQLKAQLERENENMQQRLERAENERARVVKELAAIKHKNQEDIGACKDIHTESIKQMEKIQREYEALKELQAEKEEREKEEKENLINIKIELTKKLEEAQRLHSKAIEVMSMSLEAPNGKPVSIPSQSDIEQWKKSVVALSSAKSTDTKMEGLMKIQKALKSLHDTLYEKSELSTTTPHGELQKALATMKQNTMISKTEQINQRNELMDNLKKKALGDYNEEEIEELRKVNENIQASEIFLKDIARRKAYLKSIKEIDSLMNECSALAKSA